MSALLQVRCEHDGTRITAVHSELRRPLALISRMLIGQLPEQVLVRVPLLFAICSQAQSVAAMRALEQAMQQPASASVEFWRERLLAVERLRESALRLVRDWHWPFCGEETQDSALRGLLNLTQKLIQLMQPAVSLTPNLRAIDQLSYIEAVSALKSWWLQGLPEERRQRAWLEAIQADWCDVVLGGPVEVLAPLQDEALAQALLQDRGGAFCSAPRLGQRVCVTGPAAQDLCSDAGTQLAASVLALCAQMRTAIELLDDEGAWPVSGGAAGEGTSLLSYRPASDPAGGYGVVETGRGLLIHRTQVRDGLVSHYQILAPTDWNFHTEGILQRQLIGVCLPAERALALVQQRVLSIDPCVGFEVRLTPVAQGQRMETEAQADA